MLGGGVGSAGPAEGPRPSHPPAPRARPAVLTPCPPAPALSTCSAWHRPPGDPPGPAPSAAGPRRPRSPRSGRLRRARDAAPLPEMKGRAAVRAAGRWSPGEGGQERSLRGAAGAAGSCSSRLCARALPGAGLRGGVKLIRVRCGCTHSVLRVPRALLYGGGTEGLCPSEWHGQRCSNPPSNLPHTPAVCSLHLQPSEAQDGKRL